MTPYEMDIKALRLPDQTLDMVYDSKTQETHTVCIMFNKLRDVITHVKDGHMQTKVGAKAVLVTLCEIEHKPNHKLFKTIADAERWLELKLKSAK